MHSPVQLPTPIRAAARRLLRFPTGRRTKFAVALGWILLVVAIGPLAGKVGDVENNDAISFLPRSAEATKVASTLPQFRQDDRLPTVVVYERSTGVTDADRTAVEREQILLARYAVDGESVPPAVPSADGKALMLVIPSDDGVFEELDEIRDDVAERAPDGLAVKVGGPSGELVDSVAVFGSLDGKLLGATVAVVAVFLLLTYRSPVLWLVPLVAVGIASQVANAVVYVLGRWADLPVNGQSGGILTVLVFGVGTDYALLLVARYREELHRHENRHTAMAVALRRSGPAILASAATVTAALLCLFAADLNSNRSLGGVAAIGVVCCFTVMITLLPALLVILGRWAFWPLVPRYGTPVLRRRSLWAWVAGAVARRPRLAWIGTSAALLALAAGILTMNVGISNEDMYRDTPDSVVAQRLVADHYPAGASSPAQVVAAAAAAGAVTDTLRRTEGVADVQDPVRSADGTLVLIGAVLRDAPDSPAAERTIDRIRDRVHAVPGADAAVGGPTAILLDTDRGSARDRWVVIPLALVVVLLILMALLRAVTAPLMLMATVVLSFFAAIGGSVLLYEYVLGFEGTDPTLPLLGFLFLVALGVDYTIFLMTRIKEEVAAVGHQQGVVNGLVATGGVITSAGLVLAATFSVLAVMPLVSLAEMGLLVAFGVLLDTLVVRSVLVPGLSLDLGRRIWWPGRMSVEPAAPPAREPELTTAR